MKRNFVKALSLLLACLMLCSTFAGCEKNEETGSNENRTVVDMTGNTIELPDTVEKVFVDWASGITLVTTLSATEKLVCAPTAFETDTFAWTRYNEILTEERLSTIYNTELRLMYINDVKRTVCIPVWA